MRGEFSCVACLRRLPIDHVASLSTQNTVPTPNRDTSSIRALVTLLPPGKGYGEGDGMIRPQFHFRVFTTILARVTL